MNMKQKNKPRTQKPKGVLVDTWFSINNSEVIEEKRLIHGVSITETVNCRNWIYDYNTSKPYMMKYIGAALARTNSESKGALRIMHNAQAAPVGTIVDIQFDDAAKAVYVTVHVQDDDAWAKVLAKVYTAFSWGGRAAGSMWTDELASEAAGKQILRYTFIPTELSLVDVPAIPDTTYTSIENADAGEIMTKPLDNAEKPVSVENGVYEGNMMAGRFADLVALVEYASQEESVEGQDQSIPDELKAGLRALKPAIQKYQSAQLDELAPESGAPTQAEPEPIEEEPEVDAEALNSADSVIANKATPGDSSKPKPEDVPEAPEADAKPEDKPVEAPKEDVTSKANQATMNAHASGSADDHAKAADAHKDAAAAHKAVGNNDVAKNHLALAAYHSGEAAKGAVAEADAKPEADAPAENSAKPGKGDVVVENSYSALEDRIAALEAKLKPIEVKGIVPVQNSAAKGLIYGNTKVVTREMDVSPEQDDIQNGAIDKEATRIASLPEKDRVAALIAYQLARKQIH